MKMDVRLQRMSKHFPYKMNPVKHFDLLCLPNFYDTVDAQ